MFQRTFYPKEKQAGACHSQQKHGRHAKIKVFSSKFSSFSSIYHK